MNSAGLIIGMYVHRPGFVVTGRTGRPRGSVIGGWLALVAASLAGMHKSTTVHVTHKINQPV
jgi:hypothetical protein